MPHDRISYALFLELIRRDAPFYEELARSEAIRVRWECPEIKVDIEWSRLTPGTEGWFKAQLTASRNGFWETVDFWLRAQILAHGPKVFRPTTEHASPWNKSPRRSR